MNFLKWVTLVALILGIPSVALSADVRTTLETNPEGTSIHIETESPKILSGGQYNYSGLVTSSDASGEIWHYSVVSGLTQKNISIGQAATHVLTGGWYGGGVMFEGIGGTGSVLWQTAEPVVGLNEYWVWLGVGTEIAPTADICYSVSTWTVYNDNGTPGYSSDDWMVSDDNCEVSRYEPTSATPVWTYDATGSFMASLTDAPGRYACAEDGSVFAVGGTIDGHLAVAFFDTTGSAPFMTYEDSTIAYPPRQVRITADGSKCIFRISADLYRVDIATGVLEDEYYLGSSTDCFGVSPDGSVVAHGFSSAYVATWNGTEYQHAWVRPVSGYYTGAATVAADNSTIYFGFYKSNYLSNRVYRFDVSSSTALWSYEYPAGSGGNQDIIEWMDCSDDGRWMAAASWGSEVGGGPEISVFDDLNPSSPIFSIDTPGSMFDIDISPNGQYVAATGKHVHANVMGSGTDIYFASVYETGIEGTPPVISGPVMLDPVRPNPAAGSIELSFSLSSAQQVSIGIFDQSGHLVAHVPAMQAAAGDHNVPIDIDLESGVYFCRLNGESGSGAVRFVVIR